jgi:gliding motility-associated-like protein
MPKLLCSFYLFLAVSFSHLGLNAQNCFQIESILVDACGTPEGENEMVRFKVGNAPLQTNALTVAWPNTTNPWLGVCQNASTAAKVAQINATITNCGYLLEPTGGVLPANKTVILISSVAFNTGSNSFVNLSDTLIVIFHCGTGATGNFANAGTGIRTLVMNFAGAGGCSQTVSYDRSLLVGGDGALANFDAAGNDTYSNQGCSAPIIIPDPSWTPPPPLCNSSGIVDLNALITGTTGGTWDGPGVTGNSFDPTGLSGDIDITYTVGIEGCVGGSSSETNTIQVIAQGSASWTSPGTICNSQAPINLNGLITGTSGGTWSGTGVSGNMFDPSGLNENVPITYSVGSGNCLSATVEFINVLPGGDPSWTTTTICESDNPIDLNTLVTGDAGGTWTGQGVTGSNFNPQGLSGNINITYTAAQGVCPQAVTQTNPIQVITSGDATWTSPQIVCNTQPAIDLDELVTGTAGGTWSGTGVNGSIFDPAGLLGNIQVTYTVGSGNCQSTSVETVNLLPVGDPTWVLTSVCELDAPLDLNTLITGDTGGTWTGQGVTGSIFNPQGLNGGINVTYTVGSGACSSSLFQTFTINQVGNASWNTTSICENETSVELNNLITGDVGGVWSGQGVTGSTFNITGLNGSISLTYSVGSGSCSDQLSQDITVIEAPPAPVVSADTSYCEGQTPPILTVSALPGADVSWFNISNPEAILGNALFFTPPADVSGIFAARQTIGACESNYDEVEVTVNPSPVLPTLLNEVEICNDILINAINLNASQNTFWYSDAAQTNLIFEGTSYPAGAVNAGLTSFFVSSLENGCPSATLEIPLNRQDSLSANILGNSFLNICFPDIVQLSSEDNDLNLWSTGASTQSISIDAPGIYYLSRSNLCNSYTDSVLVVDVGVDASFNLFVPENAFLPMQVQVSNFENDCNWLLQGEEFELDANSGFTLTEEVDYIVQHICENNFGCIDTASRLIKVKLPSELYIPNAFTPNGDGDNDIFIAKGFKIESLNMLIYNRWGELVFESNDPLLGWNGKFSNDIEAVEGIYTYLINAIDIYQKPYKFYGSVLLFR